MNEKLRVLHLEDKVAEVEIVQARLEEEGLACEVTRAVTREDFIAALAWCGFDLILADYTLPDFDGKTALELALARRPDVPFIFVSGTIGEDIAIDLLKSGATDYVLKSKLSRLAPAVLRALRETREKGEHKLADDELRETHAKLHHLLAHSPAVIYTLNIDGENLIPVVVSDNIERLLGFSAAEAGTYEWWLGNLHPEDRDRVLAVVGEGMKGKGYSTEYRIRDKTGAYHWIEDNNRVALDAAGRPTEAVGVWTDITEQKKLEAQLRHAQKMEAIGQLAGGIAHDFNNILNVIAGFGSLAKDNLEREHPSVTYLNEVLAASDRAACLTKRLLAFSRRQPTDLKPAHVTDIVAGLEKMLGRIIGEDIAFSTVLGGGELLAMADSGLLEQALINIAANARDSMPNGGRLTISTGPGELTADFGAAHGYGMPGKYALISVTDTGIGMDAETQRRIFDPFFTTKELGKGTGLGLSVAYGIIKQHNGYLTVESAPGKGSTFNIFLPLVEKATAEGAKAGAATPGKGGAETILVAEDDAALRQLYRIVLESFGYRVITAEDGEDAIAKFKENQDKIQLLILDMIMPRKSGREAYSEIRKISPGVKAFFASGYTKDIIDQKEMLEEGMDCLSKPISTNDLVKKVREVLDR